MAMETQELFAYTDRVTIQLSNICNMAHLHKECPLSRAKEKITLPKKIVYHVIDILKKYGYKKLVSFHSYSEPLIDPRLQAFIEYIKRECPEAKPFVCTNGFMLTQEILDDLTESGLAAIRLSAYSQAEFQRMKTLNYKIPHRFSHYPTTGWLNRSSVYNRQQINLKKPCHSPLVDLRIMCDGKISLCCVDYENRYIFGSLHEKSLEDILLSGELHRTYKRLSSGDRFLDICKRCNEQRRPKHV